MKSYFLGLIGICSSLITFAQFEGTVVWSFKMEITDPKMKSEMANTQKEMNSPTNQAKMKEMEEQMNNPEIKAMMESHPEMKMLIERQMAAMKGGGGNLVENMMPKEIEMKFKGANSLTKVMGGAFESEVLFLNDKNQSYMLDRQAKTYSIMVESKENQKDFKITKTEDFTTVLGYKCRKYQIEMTEQGQKITNNVWTTTEIKDIDIKQFSRIKVGKGSSTSFMEKLEGVPMKMQMNTPQGLMQMEVTSFKKEPLSASLFSIPVEYVEKKTPMRY